MNERFSIFIDNTLAYWRANLLYVGLFSAIGAFLSGRSILHPLLTVLGVVSIVLFLIEEHEAKKAKKDSDDVQNS